MALYMKQETEKTELQERIAAELREKAKRNSLAEGEKSKGFNPEDSAYLEGTKETTSLAFVWLLLFIAIILAIGFFVWFTKA